MNKIEMKKILYWFVASVFLVLLTISIYIFINNTEEERVKQISNEEIISIDDLGILSDKIAEVFKINSTDLQVVDLNNNVIIDKDGTIIDLVINFSFNKNDETINYSIQSNEKGFLITLKGNGKNSIPNDSFVLENFLNHVSKIDSYKQNIMTKISFKGEVLSDIVYINEYEQYNLKDGQFELLNGNIDGEFIKITTTPGENDVWSMTSKAEYYIKIN